MAKSKNGNNIEPLTLSTFIEKFKGAIADNIHQRFKPVYTLDMDTSDLDKQIDELTIRKPEMLRPLFEAQAHVTKAAKILLNDNGKRCLFVIGELGTGKTSIANALIHIMGKAAKHNLIICPPHLVNKWEREIRGIFSNQTSLQVFQIRNIRDFEKAKKEAILYDKTFFIISRERSKLSYFWKPDYILKRKSVEQEVIVTDEHGYTFKKKESVIMNLPHCPKCHIMITDKRTGTVLEEKYLQNRKLWCQHEYYEKVQTGDNNFIEVKKLCNTPLWTADGKGPRRYALADYIAKRHKNWIDTLVLDECHEHKSSGSAQGQAAGTLAGACKKTIAMTGTIFGGRSSSLFYLLYRFSPEFKKVFKYTEETEFVKKYGIQWKITKETAIQTDGRSSKRKITPSRIEEKPGISPEIILYLIDKSVFISLDDIDNTLPPYEELPREIKMLPEQKSRYDTMEKSFKRDLVKALVKGDKRLLSLYLQTCLCYPDLPLDPNIIYPKEQDLIDCVKTEKTNGRKVLIYCTHTDTRDITPHLKEILEKNQMKVEILKSHVPAGKREAWIAEKVIKGLDVLICNPALVKTGLDLIDFPTIYFYETDFNIYTMRQASRRSHRIGQLQNVEVIFSCYKNTMQESALSLVAQKMKAAEILDGELTEQGLSSYQDEGSLLLELARKMVEEIGEKDTLEEIFNSKRKTVSDSKGFIGYDMPQRKEKIIEKVINEVPKEIVNDLWNILYEQKKALVRKHLPRQNENNLSLF